jgi:predicted site-specific integrase-resolvase
MLAISPRTLRRYMADGHVPTRRLPSGHVRIRQAVIAALMGEEESLRPRMRRQAVAAPPRTARASSARGRDLHATLKCRRLPLGVEQAAVLVFDTSPEALEEARASAA